MNENNKIEKIPFFSTNIYKLKTECKELIQSECLLLSSGNHTVTEVIDHNITGRVNVHSIETVDANSHKIEHILINYHADSGDANKRKTEITSINKYIKTTIHLNFSGKIIVSGDFNENFFNDKITPIDEFKVKSISEALITDCTKILSIDCSLEESQITKERGDGFNAYINQQTYKNGDIDKGGKVAIFCITIDKDKNDQNLPDVKILNTENEIKNYNFNSDDTQGQDHANSSMLIDGIKYIQSSAVPTSGGKGYANSIERLNLNNIANKLKTDNQITEVEKNKIIDASKLNNNSPDYSQELSKLIPNDIRKKIYDLLASPTSSAT